MLSYNFKPDNSLLIRLRLDHLKKIVAMVGAQLSNDSVNQSQFIVLKLHLANFDVNYVRSRKKKEELIKIVFYKFLIIVSEM